MDLAFKSFFRRVKAGEETRLPSVQGEGTGTTVSHIRSMASNLTGSRLLSKIGDVKIVLHRPVEGTIKTLTIRRSATGKWYACFSVEYAPLRTPEGDIGRDRCGSGILRHALERREDREPPILPHRRRPLRKPRGKLSKAEKGTPERKKARKIVAHIPRTDRQQTAQFCSSNLNTCFLSR